MFNGLVAKIKENDKSKKIMTIITVMFFLFLVIGASYAYFAGQIASGAKSNINVATGTTDSLMFLAGDPVVIRATLDNFGKGGEDLKGSTTGTAKLMANDVTKQVSAMYNIFLIIDENDFVYTTDTYTPELIVRITDPNGNEVTDIDGLKRTENGYDVTTRTGGYLIRSDYDIEALGNDATTQDWQVEVTLANLDSDQRGNMGKHFNARLYLTQEKLPTYELPVINSLNPSVKSMSITSNLIVNPGTDEIDKYYFAIEEKQSPIAYINNQKMKPLASINEDLTWYESDSANYTFEDLEPETTYIVYSYARTKNDITSEVFESEVTTGKYVLPTIDSLNLTSTLNTITVTANVTKGDGDLSRYYYSSDDGLTWSEEQASNTYTFTNLNDTTKYKIKVKVEDTNGRTAEYGEEYETVTYINPSITKIDSTTTYNSITVNVTAIDGTNTIDKYYYSSDNGTTWSEGQTSNSYTFTGLDENTGYKVKVRVSDTIGRTSTIYPNTDEEITTNEYKLPVVNSTDVVTSKTTLKITATAEAKENGATISKYYFSKDGGSNWSEGQTSNTYTFINLTSDTSFNISIKVEDSNGRYSTVYTKTTATLCPDLKVTTTYNGVTGAPKTVGAIANLSCGGNSAIYNTKHNRIEVVPSSRTKCTLTYTSRTTKEYLNQKIIGLSGTTQGNGQVVNEKANIPNYDTAVALNQNQYLSISTYSATTSSTTSGTPVSNIFTYSGTEWSTNPSNMTSNTYYHFKFNVPEDGYYQMCYTMTSGSNNWLQLYNNTTSYYINGSTILASSSTNSQNGCENIGYVTKTDSIRVVQYTNNTDIVTVDFSIKKANFVDTKDAGYRYEGKNPNNFVWFNNELWRIIGVFDSASHGRTGENLVKLIRENSLGELVWDKSGKNNWETSSLKDLLNGAYLNRQDGTDSGYCYFLCTVGLSKPISASCDYTGIGIDSNYRNMIKSVTWHLGGSSGNVFTSGEVYGYERGTTVYLGLPTSWNGYIGLMYPSDYGYSVLSSSCARTTNLSLYSSATCAGQSWLYGHGRTLIHYSSTSSSVFDVNSSGDLNLSSTNSGGSYSPVLYLNASVYVIDGNGSRHNPYIIGM